MIYNDVNIHTVQPYIDDIIKFNKASKGQFWVCAGYVARLSSAGAVPRDAKGR